MHIPSYLNLKELPVCNSYDYPLISWLKHSQNSSSTHMAIATMDIGVGHYYPQFQI